MVLYNTIPGRCRNSRMSVMQESREDVAQGAIDPETLDTKQNCIGGGSFGKVYKGWASNMRNV